ncbi:MAG TPA: hypothetical protein VLL73_06025, partial [Desulfurivibrionaceae bacterium]|nr:hypothetical protein [Desulfurivibrionaceae bacterium]
MWRPNLLSFTCLLAIVLLPTLILAADPAVTPAPAKPVVLIDQGHGQRFLIEEKGTLHLSSLAGIIAGTGATVTS